MAHHYNVLHTSRVFLFISTLLFPSKVLTQSLSQSTIDFTEVPSWGDYRQCVRDCFMDLCALQCIDQLGILVGCYNEKCLCGTRTNYDLGIKQALICVKRPSSCGGEQTDQDAAKKILTDYCAMKGWDYSGGGDNDGGSSDIYCYCNCRNISSRKWNGSDVSFTHGEDCHHGKYNATSSTKPIPSQTKTQSSTATNNSDVNNDKSNPTDSPDDDSDSENTNTNNNNININTGNTGDSDGGKKSDFGTPEIIGTVVGIVSLLIGALGVYITWKARASKKQKLLEQQQAQQNQQLLPSYGYSHGGNGQQQPHVHHGGNKGSASWGYN